MFPSSSNNCDHFPFTNQLTMVSENEIPCSSQQHPSMFLHDQPIFADDNELFVSPFFSQQQILGYGSYNNVAADEIEIKIASPVKTAKKTTTKKKKNARTNGEEKVVPHKRTGKKDRHSKIYTAQGPRDRRMRLSLQIARKFFDLQDMLGFDKASKTIDWLFSKSKAAIKELMESLPTCARGCAKSLSSSSESEVVSGINKIQDIGDHQRAPTVAETLVDRKSRKSITNLVIRESRDKARARARERTIEKMKMKGLDKKSRLCSEEPNPNNLVPLADHSVSTIEKFLGITTSPRSSSIFDYTHNVGESSGASSQEKHHVYAEYNSYCAFTNMKESTGNLRAQNLGEIFNINPDTQDQESSSIYMSTRANAHEQNPSSDFNKAISNAQEQNPSSIWQINPIVDNKYCSFY